jgi:type VI secretion system protein ImpL
MNRSRWLYRIAAVALGGWMAALGVAAVQLDAWNDDLVNTLLQIRADATFRDRMAQQREAIPREWYRSKALALLAAAEKLQDDTMWTFFIPGSWRLFDNLKERVGLRIERAFSEIAVEAMRREVHFIASQVTGVTLDAATAELLPGRDCARPLPVPGSGPHDSVEYQAVRDYLGRVAELDQALQAMSDLQGPGPADADSLRMLVRYTLGAELPGRLARSTGFLRRGLKPVEAAQAALATARLQEAARCSLGKAMSALDERLFERNDLLAAEAFLAQRTTRLFAPGARPGPPGETLQALREVVTALDHQQLLLAHTDYAWLHSGAPSLGPAHEKLLATAARIPLLLGPEAVDPIRRESDKALQRFRGRFTAAFRNGGEPSLVWATDSGRLVLSPERVALRDGLVALLREPFMVQPGEGGFPVGEVSLFSWDTRRLEQAVALGPVRRRFISDSLPKFPPAVRGAIARIVDAQLAQLVQDRIIEAMSPLASGEPAAAIDAAALRAQHEQLARARMLLDELGARHSAERLRTLHEVKVPGSPSEPRA